MLIGADGVHSAIRHALFGAGPGGVPGLVAWRGVIPADGCRRACGRSAPTGSGPGGHVVHYFLRRGELMNFVGIVERTDWQVESWTDARHAGGIRGRLRRLARGRAGDDPRASTFPTNGR